MLHITIDSLSTFTHHIKWHIKQHDSIHFFHSAPSQPTLYISRMTTWKSLTWLAFLILWSRLSLCGQGTRGKDLELNKDSIIGYMQTWYVEHVGGHI